MHYASTGPKVRVANPSALGGTLVMGQRLGRNRVAAHCNSLLMASSTMPFNHRYGYMYLHGRNLPH
jgi:hypothetical protein